MNERSCENCKHRKYSEERKWYYCDYNKDYRIDNSYSYIDDNTPCERYYPLEVSCKNCSFIKKINETDYYCGCSKYEGVGNIMTNLARCWRYDCSPEAEKYDDICPTCGHYDPNKLDDSGSKGWCRYWRCYHLEKQCCHFVKVGSSWSGKSCLSCKFVIPTKEGYVCKQKLYTMSNEVLRCYDPCYYYEEGPPTENTINEPAEIISEPPKTIVAIALSKDQSRAILDLVIERMAVLVQMKYIDVFKEMERLKELEKIFTDVLKSGLGLGEVRI